MSRRSYLVPSKLAKGNSFELTVSIWITLFLSGKMPKQFYPICHLKSTLAVQAVWPFMTFVPPRDLPKGLALHWVLV